MSNEKIKIKNNANKIIFVSQKAWDAIYKDRKGFVLFDETIEKADKAIKEVAKTKSKADEETKEVKAEPKKVAKRGRPEKQGDSK